MEDLLENNEEVIVLFGPKPGKHLKQLYPELATYDEFKELSNEELLFVWYFGNPSSPIASDIEDHIKATVAAKKSIKDAEKRKKFASMEYPEKVKKAIEKMGTFSPDARMIAKRVIQTAFANLQSMANVKPEDFYVIDTFTDKEGKITTTKTTDWAGRNQYVNSVSKITETLPVLLAQLEHGFGIDVKTGKEVASTGGINQYHQHKKDG